MTKKKNDLIKTQWTNKTHRRKRRSYTVKHERKKWSGICYLFFYQGSTMWSDKLHVLEPRWDPVRGFRFLMIWKKKKKKRKRREEWKNKDILWNSHHLCSIEAGMSCPQMKTFKNSTFHWVMKGPWGLTDVPSPGAIWPGDRGAWRKVKGEIFHFYQKGRPKVACFGAGRGTGVWESTRK